MASGPGRDPSALDDDLPPTYAAIPSDGFSPSAPSSSRVPASLEQQQADGPDGPDQAPPEYASVYGRVNVSQDGLDTKAVLSDDGRVNINIAQRNARLSSLLAPALRTQWRSMADEQAELPPGVVPEFAKDVPPMNILIQIIGSRGDVQPFVALGQVLKNTYGHRVRLATHPNFQSFVEDNGLEFFSLGGDPSELMAFMVKNPGLMPGMDSLKAGDVGKRRKGMWDVILGGWRACIEPGDGTGYAPALSGEGQFTGSKPFIADAIIANPPSFGHIHCAEKLGCPLHIMFTMPWSPTQAFPHPLANIQSTDAEHNVTNFLSYALVEMLTWQGLGDLVNRFREKTLGLEPISSLWAPGMMSRLKVPYTYCWSPALIPKPQDWASQISISGFFFLSLASSYTPPPDLADFLAAGPPPVYIGFGSIVVDDPNGLTELILNATRNCGARCLVSKGWGGIGSEELDIPEGVMLLGNCPHDWLFPQCAAVVHHGGAGTTAAGISAGKPTVVVPFFGDQPFWGAMVARAGAGPDPIPYKKLSVENLTEAIQFSISPETQARAKELGDKIRDEKGAENGAKYFHTALGPEFARCEMFNDRVAVWRVKGTDIKLSTLAASILVQKNAINGGYNGLRLYRHKEWLTDEGPWEPVTGAATALMGTALSIMMGVGDIPKETFRAFSRKKSKYDESLAGPPRESSNNWRDEKKPLHPNMSSDSLSTQESRPGTPSIRTITRTETDSSIKSSAKSSTKSGKEKEKEGTGMSDSLNAAIGSAKGIGRIGGAFMKSPMDFSLGIAQGFRNAPRIYGDTTVRPQEKITGIQSGIKVAGKEFTLGMYDGISGLVTQPFRGAREEGAMGFVKGTGKGVAGALLKPGAALWGLPGYAMKGVHRELRKFNTPNVFAYIMSARIAQGETELFELEGGINMNAIVKQWYKLRDGRVGHRWEKYIPEFSKKEGAKKGKGKKPTVIKEGEAKKLVDAPPEEFERAIRESVRATSNGDPAEDEVVERAIRASVYGLRQAAAVGGDDYDEEAVVEHAVAVGIAERYQFQPRSSGEDTDTEGVPPNYEEFENRIGAAFRQSMINNPHYGGSSSSASSAHGPPDPLDLPEYSDTDSNPQDLPGYSEEDGSGHGYRPDVKHPLSEYAKGPELERLQRLVDRGEGSRSRVAPEEPPPAVEESPADEQTPTQEALRALVMSAENRAADENTPTQEQLRALVAAATRMPDAQEQPTQQSEQSLRDFVAAATRMPSSEGQPEQPLAEEEPQAQEQEQEQEQPEVQVQKAQVQVQPGAQVHSRGPQRPIETCIAPQPQETNPGTPINMISLISSYGDNDNDSNPDEDEEFRRAMEESQRMSMLASTSDEDELKRVLEESLRAEEEVRNRPSDADAEEQLRKVMEESIREEEAARNRRSTMVGSAADDEEAVRRAMEESLEAEEAEERLRQQEEEIVMRHVMKMSILEEELRQKRQQERQRGAVLEDELRKKRQQERQQERS